MMEAFIASRLARGCSVKYVDWLRYTLGHLLRAEDVLPDRPEPLEAVLAGLKVLSDETKYDVWTAMRRLYLWAARRYGVADAMAVVESPIRRTKVIRTLTQLEVDRLLWTNQRRPRDFALLLLLLDTGARIGEAAGLVRSDVGVSVLRLSGKTGEREVPISMETVRALERVGDRDCLWVGERGPLGLHGLQQVVRRCLRRAGLRGGPHLLRHTFGTLYILSGGNSFSLKKVMGHRRIETSEKYVDLDLRNVQEQHARFSPVARRAAAGGS